jgi:F-box/leucine-rich repeat protein 10/11
MARELRWRVRAAAGVDSGDELEDETGAAVKKEEEAANGAMEVEPATPVESGLGKKRRRQDAKPIFRNWQPPEWEKVETVPTRETQADLSVEEDAEGWMKGEGLAGHVKRTLKVNEVSKIRRLGNGTIERYRVVRTVEYVVPGNMT